MSQKFDFLEKVGTSGNGNSKPERSSDPAVLRGLLMCKNEQIEYLNHVLDDFIARVGRLSRDIDDGDDGSCLVWELAQKALAQENQNVTEKDFRQWLNTQATYGWYVHYRKTLTLTAGEATAMAHELQGKLDVILGKVAAARAALWEDECNSAPASLDK